MERREARAAARICSFLILCAVVFLVLIAAAMILYPGSDRLDSTSSGYSLARNFLSELGASRTFADQANYASMAMFVVALFLVGLGLILFSLNYRVIWLRRRRGLTVGKASLAAGVLSGIGFIAVAANPQNINSPSHILATIFAFDFLFLYVALLLALQVMNGWDRSLVYANAAYLSVLAVNVVLVATGYDIDTVSGLMTHVISQKVVIVASLVNLALQAWGLRREALRQLDAATSLPEARGSDTFRRVSGMDL